MVLQGIETSITHSVLFFMLSNTGVSSACTIDENITAPIAFVSPRTVHYQFTTATVFGATAHEQLTRAEEESEDDEQDKSHQYSDRHEQRRSWNESRAGQALLSDSSNLDAYDVEQRERTCPKSGSSYHAPQQHSPQNLAEGQDTDWQQQEKPILYLWNFSAYNWAQSFSFNTTFVAVVLTALMCMQIFLVSVDCYESYNIRSEHSQCSCSFPYPWLVTAAVRIASRFAFPLLLSIVFWRQVVCSKAAALEGQAGAKGTLAAEIEKEHNRKVVREIIQKLSDISVKPTESVKKHLKLFRDQMNDELTWMCIAALVQSVVLVSSFIIFHLVDTPEANWFDSSFWLGAVHTLSFGIILALSGIMLSFYFLESKIKCYVRTVHTLSSTSRTLRDKAKDMEHCITDRWYPLEIGIRFASVVIPTILLVNWASDIPLSCGFSVSTEAITKQSAAACWMGFIVVVTVGQVMVTSPFNPIYIRFTGLSMEVAILFIFYWTFPTYKWMQLSHILYAIVPLSYLIWYHIASISRQWLAMNGSKQGNPTYVSRLASRTGLLILILATLVASLRVEYSHLHPSAIDKYSSADFNTHIQLPTSIINRPITPAGIKKMQHVPADYEKALLQELAHKYSAMLYFVEEKLESKRKDRIPSQGQGHYT